MKNIFNIHNISLLLIIVIVSIFSIINVNATITWDGGTNTVTVSRAVTNATNPVTNTFTYTITADSNNPAGATGVPTSPFTIVMTDQAISGTTATKTTTLDFSNMSFNEPGHYIYTIAESASSNATLYPKSSATFTVEIVVHNTDASAPDGTNYTAYLFVKNSSDTKVATAAFTSAYAGGRITLNKTTTGNIGNVNEYFPFEIKLYTPIKGTYNITGLTALTAANSCTGAAQTATMTIECTNNAGCATTPATKTICLKSDQTATIGYKSSKNQLPKNSKIDIIETNGDYTTTYKIGSNAAVSGSSITNHTIATGATAIVFTNTKSETTPTGVLITTLPYIILIAIGGTGVFLFMNSKKRKLATVNDEII